MSHKAKCYLANGSSSNKPSLLCDGLHFQNTCSIFEKKGSYNYSTSSGLRVTVPCCNSKLRELGITHKVTSWHLLLKCCYLSPSVAWHIIPSLNRDMHQRNWQLGACIAALYINYACSCFSFIFCKYKKKTSLARYHVG